MGAASPITSLAATGLSAGSKILQGDTTASNDRWQAAQTYMGDQYKANQDEIDASYGEAKASQTDSFMRNQLVSALAGITAARASANVGGDSPTGYAIGNRVEEQSDEARDQRVTNIRAQVSADKSSALLEKAAGLSALSIGDSNASAARTNGLLGGFGSILSGISGLVGPNGGLNSVASFFGGG